MLSIPGRRMLPDEVRKCLSGWLAHNEPWSRAEIVMEREQVTSLPGGRRLHLVPLKQELALWLPACIVKPGWDEAPGMHIDIPARFNQVRLRP